jgi:oligopeptide/dipeptide ABC transporter ATP-binding protein
LNPFLTACETVAEVFRVWDGLSKSASRESSRALLAEVGLVGEATERKPGSLSGGQRQRVGIARALACRPEALIADEPTSSLDVSVQAQILNLLASLRESRSLALILVSHDLSVIRHATERAIVMFDGHVVEQAPTAELFERPRHPYTRLLIDSAPERMTGTRPVVNESVAIDGRGCVFARRCSGVRPDCLDAQPPLVGGGGHDVSCFHPIRYDAGRRSLPTTVLDES